MINPFPNSIKKEIHLKREIQGNSFNLKLKIILEEQKIGEWVLCPQFFCFPGKGQAPIID
jgi:hypothetical protein